MLSQVPQIDAFPTVDELAAFTAHVAATHPDRVTLREIGRSRQGVAVQLLSLHATKPRGSVLVVGQPHPNEPIGMATVRTLVELLLADPVALDATAAEWHFVPCADPDGTRLNEGWFAGPFTREFYARHFFRPQGSAQVEWTFPFRRGEFVVDAPLPETRALMAAIDLVRPDVLASLHNGELGGAYFYATPGADALYPKLTDLCERYRIPLHLGDPETPFSVELAPAVFSVPTADQMYDMAAELGADPAALVSGASSLAWAERYKPVLGVVVELPYWRDPRAADVAPEPEGRSRREVVLRGLEHQAGTTARLRELLAAASPLPASPFADAVDGFVGLLDDAYLEGQRRHAATSPEFERPATVADVFSTRDNVHMFRLRLTGMLLRALPDGSPVRPEAQRTFDEWCAEAAAEGKAEVIPIRDLVAVQAGAILVAADHFRSNQNQS